MMSNAALVGFTGLVGSTLAQECQFEALFNSKNIEDIAGRSFDTIVCAGAPAAKWQANKQPQRDFENIEGLVKILRRTRTSRFVLISTVDVFHNPNGMTELCQPTLDGLHPYGRHRYHLELELAKIAPTTIIRLPALFGDGLKKNAIYDILNNNAVEKIDSRGTFQFYNLKRLSSDIQRALNCKIQLLHAATQPISMRDICSQCFEFEFSNMLDSVPPSYDFRSIHDALWDSTGGYLYRREQIIRELREFVVAYKGKKTK